MFEHIEERYNNPTEEMKRQGVNVGSGMEKIFEVRELESDTSFIRNYLSKELIMQEDMYLFQKQGKEYKISDKSWENVRDQLVFISYGDVQHILELILKGKQFYLVMTERTCIGSMCKPLSNRWFFVFKRASQKSVLLT